MHSFMFMSCILGLSFEPICQDSPTSLVFHAAINLLRCVMVGLGLHSASLLPQTSHSAACLLLHILQSSTSVSG